MNKVNVFTSTGNKLILHPHTVWQFKNSGVPKPISLQVAPTSLCNLHCTFCSNANRDKKQHLPVINLKSVIMELSSFGLKTVEWTGGGDPTLYPWINEAIEFCNDLGLEQGFITNGIALKEKVSQENLDRLKWLRISVNSLEYAEHIEIPEMKGTMGFSYVWEDKLDVFDTVMEYTKRYQPAYVRIVPNCLATDEDQRLNNIRLSKVVEDLGPPYFYQAKIFKCPSHCYWAYFKPFILHDGWIYPCSSVVLNEGAEGQFHRKYRVCKIEEMPTLYTDRAKPLPTDKCNHCVFYNQNVMLMDLLNPNGMENFI